MTKQSGPLSVALAGLLRAELALQKRDQKDLSEATGISKSSLSELLNDKVQIKVDVLDKLCYALGMPFLETLAKAHKVASTRHAAGWEVRSLVHQVGHGVEPQVEVRPK